MSLIPTAQVFMTCRDILEIFHEPFGDAFYYGPEKISPAHLRWPTGKIEKSGRGHYTYNHVLQGILDAVKVRDFIVSKQRSLLTRKSERSDIWKARLSQRHVVPHHTSNPLS